MTLHRKSTPPRRSMTMTFEDEIPSWRTLARLRLDDWKAERERRIQAESNARGWMQTSEEWQATAEEWEKRALRARKERDDCRHDARAAESALSRVRAALGLPDDATTDDMEEAAESRPLTLDAITDEMVERARNAPSFNGRLSPTPRLVREMLTAALTEPPTRPEGAERWEDFLIDSLDYQALTDQQITDLADRIAEEMNR